MRSKLDSLVNSTLFQRIIIGAIILAGVTAGVDTNPLLSERYGTLLRMVDSGVLMLFTFEIAAKIAARGPAAFFRDGWNIFDFAIVIACAVPSEGEFAAVFRLARGLRVLRLISSVPRLQLLVGALLNSLSAMGYVGVLLGMVFYVYGVAGVHLFGKVSEEHFGSLGAALLTLFKLITLDNWSEIYATVSFTSTSAAVLYFVSFILLGTMIMLNLFIGIIMNSMSEMHRELEEKESAAMSRRVCLQDELRDLDKQLTGIQARIKRLQAFSKESERGAQLLRQS